MLKNIIQKVYFTNSHVKQVHCLSCIALRTQHTTAASTVEDGSNPDILEASLQERQLPLMTSRKLAYKPPYRPGRQTWLETLSSIEDVKLGIVDLHPDIFATHPRLHVLWWNLYWQKLYKRVDYEFVRSRAECIGGGRKPWPQKGLGKARHGSIRSPLWRGGGKSFGPRGPKSYFFMCPISVRVHGLRVALSVKLAQNLLHVVDSLDIPSDDPQYLQELAESRGWGLSVLFVDDLDVVPENIAIATDAIKSYNLMPVYGLNCYSMMKHETLVLTLAAVEKIEEKLLFQMHRTEFREPAYDRNAIHYSQPHIPK